MAFVDQRRVARLGLVDERRRRLDPARVERDADYLEALRMQLISQLPPPGQIEPASSPGRPGDHEHLRPAQRTEREVIAVAVRQDDLRQRRARERPATGRL